MNPLALRRPLCWDRVQPDQSPRSLVLGEPLATLGRVAELLGVSARYLTQSD